MSASLFGKMNCDDYGRRREWRLGQSIDALCAAMEKHEPFKSKPFSQLLGDPHFRSILACALYDRLDEDAQDIYADVQSACEQFMA